MASLWQPDPTGQKWAGLDAAVPVNSRTLMPSKPDYSPPADLLAGRVIAVTGAADGIGRAAAQAFAAHGATVVLLDRVVERLESLYDTIEDAGHPQPAIYPIDLEKASPDDYAQLGTTLAENFDALHGLLHNAATLAVLSPFEMIDIETWYKVLQTNLNAPFHITRACLPLLKQADDASVLFTGDAVGRSGRPYWGAYGVSKAGLEGMMQTLATELSGSTRVRANSIAPVPTRTRLRARAYPGENPATLPAPADIMGTYLYLMGPDSREINGEAWDAPPVTG